MPEIRKYTDKNIHYIYLVIVILAAAILRSYDLNGESYWYDEFRTLEALSGDLNSIVYGKRPPLYILMAYYWTKVFGLTEPATRALSVLFGIFAIPLIYLVGKELFDRRVGLVSAFLMSVSQFQIYYSQEFRYYILYVFMTLCSFHFFIAYLKKPVLNRLLPYIISTILMFYSHDFGIFSIAVQAVYYSTSIYRNRKADYRLLIGFTIISLSIINELISAFSKVATKSTGPTKWLPETSIYDPFLTLRNYIGSGLDYPSYTTILSGLLFLFIGTLIFISKNRYKNWINSLISTKDELGDVFIKKEVLLIILWLLIPIFIPFIISIVKQPIYHHRYTIGASPAFYILIASFVVAVRRVFPEILTLSVMLVILTPGLYNFYKIPVREQWREAAQLIREDIKKDDILIFNNDWNNFKSFKWYYKDDFDICIINTHKGFQNFARSLNDCAKGKNRVWFIVREVPDPLPITIRSEITNKKNKLINLLEVFHFTKITVYLLHIKDK